MPARIIDVRDPANLRDALSRAASVILSGGIVAVPTESFYGLAVNAMDETAVRRLLAVKRIEGGHPILLLVHAAETLPHCVKNIPPSARRLMERFWPGGLTLVMQAAPGISPLLTAGTGKIGVRVSSHPVAAALAGSVGVPITGTSANITGEEPCVSAGEVRESLGNELDLVLDGGRTEGGKGSTVLDLTTEPPRILREGMIDAGQLDRSGVKVMA